MDFLDKKPGWYQIIKYIDQEGMVLKFKNREEHIKQIITETRSGNISRRCFIKLMSWSGISAAAALSLLDFSTCADAADLPVRKTNPEIDRMLKELSVRVNEYNTRAAAMSNEDDNLNDQGDENVFLRLTYPAGKSEKVFQAGWIFGAECLVRPISANERPQNLSNNVEWSGTARFSNPKGSQTWPTFNNTGLNTIILAINYNRRRITRTIRLDVVSTQGYATIGSIAFCPADAHGCPACPHPTRGPVIVGSPNVLINGKPAARMGDTGIHAACCGPNVFTIAEGDPLVLINGKPAAKSGSKTIHCGGVGRLL
jgi:uncharacterized Zn-binding protein involved in type VI secretion